MVDEADGMEVGAEGDPIKLGERRTQTFANRKIIIGSTPVFADTSTWVSVSPLTSRRRTGAAR